MQVSFIEVEKGLDRKERTHGFSKMFSYFNIVLLQEIDNIW